MDAERGNDLVSTFHYRPAKREHTPLVVGLAGPTKSGKTYSAHRLAAGMANGGPVVMINAEGAKGHQYADKFEYLATDIQPPYGPARYNQALNAALSLDPKPAVVIIDSMSHMHDGPGGMLEYHESELDRLAGNDYKARQRSTWTAWIKPKAEENEFIYSMLGAGCHIILCFRAKQKLKIVRGQEPIDLGWQPISSDRVTFETLFTLVLPPHSRGVPDLAVSEMREAFEEIIPAGQSLSEETGKALSAWSEGGEPVGSKPAAGPKLASEPQRRRLFALAKQNDVDETRLREILAEVTGQESTAGIPADQYDAVVAAVETAQVTA